MQIFNNNLKSVIQTRINAATSATPLKDLMLLAKAARGLGVNSATLDALIAGKLNELNGASPLADLLVGSVAAGLVPDPVAALVTQNAVKAGDPMWVDGAGNVYGGDKYRMKLAAFTGTLSSQVFNCYLPLDGHRTVNNWDNNRIGFTALLSDGNYLVGFGNGQSSSYGYNMALLSGGLTTFLKSFGNNLMFVYSDGASAYYARPIAVYRTAANTFRVYYRHARNNTETDTAVISYYQVTYNPANQTVAVGARQEIFNSGTNTTIAIHGEGRFNSDRYVIFRVNSTGYSYVLDLQTATATEIVAARSLSYSATVFMGTGTDLCAWIKPSSGNGFIVRPDATTVESPSNLNTDGALSTSARIVAQLTKGVFLSIASGLLKVVTFNSAYTTATIQTLASDSLRINTGGTVRAVRLGKRFYIYRNSGSPFSFELDQNGIASGFRWEDRELAVMPRFMEQFGELPVFDVNETFVYLTGHGVANNAGLFSGPVIEFMGKQASFVGTAMAEANAGSPCLVNLDPKVQPSVSVTYDLHAPYFSGYRRQADRSEKMLDYVSTTTNSTGVLGREAARTVGGSTTSIGSYAVFSLPSSEGILYGQQADSFSISLINPLGTATGSGSSNGVALWFSSAFPLYCYNNRDASTTYKNFS